MPAHLTAERLDRLRRADAIVRKLSQESGFDQTVWQFPVVLIPLGTAQRPDSVVLRPIDSVDGMTARAVRLPAGLLAQMVQELMRSGRCGRRVLRSHQQAAGHHRVGMNYSFFLPMLPRPALDGGTLDFARR